MWGTTGHLLEALQPAATTHFSNPHSAGHAAPDDLLHDRLQTDRQSALLRAAPVRPQQEALVLVPRCIAQAGVRCRVRLRDPARSRYIAREYAAGLRDERPQRRRSDDTQQHDRNEAEQHCGLAAAARTSTYRIQSGAATKHHPIQNREESDEN